MRLVGITIAPERYWIKIKPSQQKKFPVASAENGLTPNKSISNDFRRSGLACLVTDYW